MITVSNYSTKLDCIVQYHQQPNIPLRPYQQESVSRILSHWKQGNKRVLAQQPTGAGKCHGKIGRFELLEVAKRLNYKPGWAHHKYLELSGKGGVA